MLESVNNFSSIIETLCAISSITNNDIDDDILKNISSIFIEYHANICSEFDEKISDLIKIASDELNRFEQNIDNYDKSINFKLLFDINLSDIKNLSQEELSKIQSDKFDFEILNFYKRVYTTITNKTSFGNENTTDTEKLIGEYRDKEILNVDGSTNKDLLTPIFDKYNEIYKYSITEIENVYDKLKDCRDFSIQKIQMEFPLGKCTIDQMSLIIIRAILFITKSYIVLYEVLNLYLSILCINTKTINEHFERSI